MLRGVGMVARDGQPRSRPITISEAALIELVNGTLKLGLAPQLGGSVAYFRCHNVNLMRPLSEEARAARNVLGVAMFPMAPYANRIENNEFEFAGRTWRFAANNPPELYNVHGTAWRLPWTERHDRCNATLSLEVVEPDEPYSYRMTQSFELRPDGLDVTLEMSNLGALPMPFGFGLHPWFVRDRDVELQFRAERMFHEGPNHTASHSGPLSAENDFSHGMPLPQTWRNNDFGGWDGQADIRFPSRGLGLRLEAEPIFRHLMLYADPTKPYFCIEPQTNAPGALNVMGTRGQAERDAIVLEPGQYLRGRIRFLPHPL